MLPKRQHLCQLILSLVVVFVSLAVSTSAKKYGQDSGGGSKRSLTPRVSAPQGATVVRGKRCTQGEFSSIQAAVESLPHDDSARTIFVYPGTYAEQVKIVRPGHTTVLGYSSDPSSPDGNIVTIVSTEGPALEALKDGLSLYNINLNGSSIALASSGNRHGYYGISLTGKHSVHAGGGKQIISGSLFNSETPDASDMFLHESWSNLESSKVGMRHSLLEEILGAEWEAWVDREFV